MSVSGGAVDMPRRPDQDYSPPPGGVVPGARTVVRARQLIIQGAGGGVFVYDLANNLVDSIAFMAGVDPLTHTNDPGIANRGTVGGLARQVQINAGVINFDNALAIGGPYSTAGSLGLTQISAGPGTEIITTQTGSFAISSSPGTGGRVYLAPSGVGSSDTLGILIFLAAGLEVVLLPGTFGPLTASLAFAVDKGRLRGCGWDTQVQFPGDTISPAIGMADTTVRNVDIRNLRLTNTAATPAGIAVDASFFHFSKIKNVLIDGATKNPNVGVQYTGTTGNHYNAIEDCVINVDGANAVGLAYTGGGGGAISNTARNMRIIPSTTDATQTGIIVASRSIELDHVDIEHAAGIGVDIQAGGDACLMTSPYLESNGTNVQFAAGVVVPVILGGTILTGVTADITDNGAISPVIRGVRTTAGVPYNRDVMQSASPTGRILQVINTATPSDVSVRLDAKAAGDQQIGGGVTGDSGRRWRTLASGQMDHGSGTGAPTQSIIPVVASALYQVASADLAISTVGRGLQIKEGSNARMGTAVMNGTTNVVVPNTSITANTRIIGLTVQVPGGTPGKVIVVTRSVGVSITIVSDSATDTSTVAFMLVEPA